jgi:hypothetical protein
VGESLLQIENYVGGLLVASLLGRSRPASGRPAFQRSLTLHMSRLLIKIPSPGPEDWKEFLRGGRAGWSNKFGVQNLVEDSKKGLGFKTWSADLVLNLVLHTWVSSQKTLSVVNASSVNVSSSHW